MLKGKNNERFDTLLSVKSSLITLYLALTFPIIFISNDNLRVLSIICFISGFILTFNITNDFVTINENSIKLNTSLVSNFFGKKSWELFWKDISLIKTFSTSQGSKVHYFITSKNKSFLIPQRIERIGEFKEILSRKLNFFDSNFEYISPLWTYKLLTFISSFMLLGEIYLFVIK
tara:strand:- start:72 stop:596 length:525 start_codon:yes stop_codon:yes gene_type:complete